MSTAGAAPRRHPRTGALVGRAGELQTLRATVAAVAGGAASAVLLTGLPGVGKTRLAQEALALAAASGFATFAGRAHDLGRDVPYAPLVAALGTELRDADETRRAALLGDLPQLGLLFTGLDLPEPRPLGDPAMERLRLIDGLSRLVERLARERPLALLVDDVHSADPSTTAFLHYLIESVTERPILLILTARPDEPGTDRLATIALDLAAATWSSAQIQLGPLSTDDAAELVENLLGHRTDGPLSSLIVERCAGRPLFVEAVTRTLVEQGRLSEVEGVLRLNAADVPLPDAVRDQLRIRLSGIGPDERALLNTLAVADGDLDYPLLTAAAQLPPDRSVDALDRLHARGLLRTDSAAGQYDVVHGLLRDTLLAELSPAATVRIHAQLAEALIESDADDPRIAEHVLHAGPLIAPERALNHLLRGADHAASLAAGEDAVRYLEAALAVAERLERTELAADLHGRIAAMLRRRGNIAGAQASWTAALAAYTSLAQPAPIARIEQELGMLDWSTGDLSAARAHFDAAQRALAGLEPSPAHAALLFTETVIASRVGDDETVARSARALRDLAERLGSPALSAQAYLAEAVLDYAAGDYVAMVQTNLHALDAATASGDPLLVHRAYEQLSVAVASQLDLPALRRYTAESLRIAEELGAPVLGGFGRSRLAAADLLSGDWESALQHTTEMTVMTRRLGERRGSVSGFAAHAWVLAHRGRLADAESYLAQAHEAALPMLEADRNVFTIVAMAEATLALWHDDPARAVERAAQLESATGGWMPLLGLSILGEARARSGDLDGARAIVQRYGLVRSCSTVAPATFAHWVTGIVDATDGLAEQAVSSFSAAEEGFARLGLPFHAARARLAAATAGSVAQPRLATERARSALETFDGLGAPIQAQQARDLLRELGVVPSRGRARSATGGPLSARELEVARLVASGLSNADVATSLFISPRTVTTHLDRIYTRLGLSSRVALTRYLADSGLLDEEAG